MIELFDLAGADENVRFSPYCWRTRMALAHKELKFKTIPWRFTDRQALAFSGQARVPVILDDGKTVFDSWRIAEHLEEKYADRRSLFSGEAAKAHIRFINHWADTMLLGGIARLIVADLLGIVAEKDKAYFRSSREERFGMPLEDVQKDRETAVVGFRESLAPLRRTFAAQPFLGGEEPSYADYIVCGTFQWARASSAFELLEATDAVADWRERMLDLHDGLARWAPVAR